MINVDGYFVKILFHNEQNYYTVALFKVKNIDSEFNKYKNKIITLSGAMPNVTLDQNYQIDGQFVKHDKYGEQLNVQTIKLIKPTDYEGIVSFLSSSLFKGIGKNTAIKIVDHLGEDALNKIIKSPGVLDQVDLTLNQKQHLIDTLALHENSQEYIVKLTNLGFKMETAFDIYNHYKLKTDSVFNNLYQLCLEVPDIIFKEVDYIVKRNNLTYEDHTYYQSVILEYIKLNTINNVNTVVYLDQVYHRFSDMFSEEQLMDILKTLKKLKLIYFKDNVIWLENIYKCELTIAKFFNQVYPAADINVDKLVKNHHLHIDQQQAIKDSFVYKNSIITGGPGTGKTTIVKYIIDIYKSLNPKMSFDDLVILAPTGKAAKRVTEACHYPASTIHRFLKWNKENDTFEININQKAAAKIVIVDEASMVDTVLLASLIRGIHDDTKLILVGDYHQLPSIRAGQVLKDLIDSKLVNTSYLTHVYRHQEGSNINLLGHAIIEEDYDFVQNANDNASIFYHHLSPQQISDYIFNEINSLKSLEDFTILIPMYRGINGIDNINNMISEKLHSNQANHQYGDTIYRIKDKVLLTTNLPDMNIFNGDIGYISDIDYDLKEIYMTFDDVIFDFKFAALKDFKLGYAISIHKSQGSEYKKVIIVLDKQHANMLDRQLLYTAITRAKKELHIVGDISLLINAIKHKPRIERNTYLKELMYNN